ncbi:MAG: ATP-binding cassette domain-containing protein, partial [Geminicoccaceae bacterium]
LSSGERQRLALARALLLAPRALLLDEATAALDQDTGAVVEAILCRQLQAGVAILMVTHDPAQAGRMAARIVRVEAGQVHQERT